MKVYHYDQMTTAYLGCQEAPISPADGQILLPACSTLVAPPLQQEGFTPFWDANKNEWRMMPITNEQATLAVVGWLATPEEKRRLLDDYVITMYDSYARSCDFVSMAEAEALSVAVDIDPYVKTLASALAAWRAQCGAKMISIKAAAVESNGPMPSAQQIVQQLPKFNRPAPPAPPPAAPPEDLTPEGYKPAPVKEHVSIEDVMKENPQAAIGI